MLCAVQRTDPKDRILACPESNLPIPRSRFLDRVLLERSGAQRPQRAAAVWLRGAAVSGLALGSGFGLRLEGSNLSEHKVFVL